uniref:thymidylate synthase n=1 Tax=viral metagenome TaxID=1070528 RepID=A0A6C0AY65_9ZZZZ|tara:strand:- start:32545 stop:33462 length:918 start_codon:yes stop_codon:yes gene_type:complete
MLKKALENLKKGKDDDIHDEYQYISLISDILNYGIMVSGRNGNTLTIFGSAMHFNLDNNIIPILTTKRVAWKTCAKELFWFLRGSTDNSFLREKNVHIWDANASRDFLDSRNLQHLDVNDLGPVYGHQWRFFNAPYSNCKANYSGKGVDQLQYIIDCLKDPVERYSRRLVMSAWNPEQLNEMALPPCHILAQFNVIGNELSCSLYQRSGDVGLGVPFNIASYSFLTHILAKHCGLIAKEFVYYLGNSHIYDDHIEILREQIKRKPLKFPKIQIKNVYDSIDNYSLEDIEIINYSSHPPIKMEMRK